MSGNAACLVADLPIRIGPLSKTSDGLPISTPVLVSLMYEPPQISVSSVLAFSVMASSVLVTVTP